MGQENTISNAEIHCDTTIFGIILLLLLLYANILMFYITNLSYNYAIRSLSFSRTHLCIFVFFLLFALFLLLLLLIIVIIIVTYIRANSHA